MLSSPCTKPCFVLFTCWPGHRLPRGAAVDPSHRAAGTRAMETLTEQMHARILKRRCRQQQTSSILHSSPLKKACISILPNPHCKHFTRVLLGLAISIGLFIHLFLWRHVHSLRSIYFRKTFCGEEKARGRHLSRLRTFQVKARNQSSCPQTSCHRTFNYHHTFPSLWKIKIKCAVITPTVSAIIDL